TRLMLIIRAMLIHVMLPSRILGTGLTRHRPAGQRTVLGRGEQPQRRPHVLPRPARSPSGVEDDELQPCATQEVAGSKPGLAAADDDDIDHVLGTSSGSSVSESSPNISVRTR